MSGLGAQLEAFSRTEDFEVLSSELNKGTGLFRRKHGRCSTFDPDDEQFVLRTDYLTQAGAIETP
ncbi:hypothetical protein ACI01nite_22590 [Acetobacter cibinongensis]|uniref:Uncharacterized protein n=1 Tax=Acetobacter cibinongensis TaxID=146475 RepID=A0A0D6N7D2_9PROT|nr:hypothetical protein Abci_025_018 [Acetobacter cibinongensis]GEL59657.1 hypothetical protein ACI01nite_22590 [Acetobacter cibinongensis]